MNPFWYKKLNLWFNLCLKTTVTTQFAGGMNTQVNTLNSCVSSSGKLTWWPISGRARPPAPYVGRPHVWSGPPGIPNLSRQSLPRWSSSDWPSKCSSRQTTAQTQTGLQVEFPWNKINWFILKKNNTLLVFALFYPFQPVQPVCVFISHSR